MDVELPEKLYAFREPARYKVAYGGRGAAKSWGFARQFLLDGFERPMRFLCAREIQTSIADSVHKLLSDQIKALGLQSFYRVRETAILGVNGTEFGFTGLRQQDVGKIKSWEGVDRCWVEEAQTVTRKSWETLIPTIRKPGSEIWVSFNPDLDTDETYQRFVVDPPEGAVVVNINYRDNPWFPDVLEQERLRLQRRDPEGYANVWEGKCKSAVDGAIYSAEIAAMHEAKRFTNVPYQPGLNVHCIYDLGWNDALAIIMAQRIGSEVRVIDYIEDSHRSLDSYVQELSQRPYAWGFDWIPHDGAAQTLAAGGQSTEQILRRLGRKVKVMARDDVEEGIKAARLMFPRVYFDKGKSVRLVDCLKRYRRAIHQKTADPGAPVHDEYSHGADAFRYMALTVDQFDNSERRKVDMDPRRHGGEHSWLR